MPPSDAAVAALLFDLDGTLVDTADANARAYAMALDEARIVVAPDAMRRLSHGRNWRQFLPEIISAAKSDADAAAIAKRKRELYPAMLDDVRLNEGLLALLRSARETFRTALVTTASRVNVLAVLERKRIADLFDTLVTGDDVSRHKPDPEAYQLAARRLGVAPALCLAFEDSAVGVASAQAAGMRVVAVSSDFPADVVVERQEATAIGALTDAASVILVRPSARGDSVPAS